MDLQDWCISKLIMTRNVDLEHRKPTISWAVLKSMWSLGQERWLPSSTLLPCYPISSTSSGSRTHIRKIWTYSNRSWEGSHRWSEGWSSFPVGTGWEIWDCLAWRKNDSVKTIRKDRQAYFIRQWSDRMKGNDFKQKDGRFDLRKNFLHCKSGETLEQVAQRRGCLIPESVQGHVGWSFEQPLYWKVSLSITGIGNWIIFIRSLPAQTVLWFIPWFSKTDSKIFPFLRKDCISHWRKSKLNLLVCYTSQKPYDNAQRTAKSVREETV